jgi:hypothetical protein
MTRSTPASEKSDDDAPSLTRGARARRALILRRAANRTPRRILRSLNAEPGLSIRPVAAPAFDQSESDVLRAPLGRPVQPDEALDERNRWGGRL